MDAARATPDFIIGGAMKCATTSLHHTLSSHSEIFIPDGEVHFFDLDDVEQHPDFFPYYRDEWYDHDFEREFERQYEWYLAHFQGAHPGQLIGEDSPAYLAGAKTAERIRRVLPNVKLVFSLRHPVARTYSHYWHLVANRGVSVSFETALQFCPGTLISRSFYKRQLERYYELFPPEQILVVIFEALKQDGPREIARILEFLGVSGDERLESQHRNATRIPRWPSLQLLQSRLVGPGSSRRRWRSRLDMPPVPEKGLWNSIKYRISHAVNPLQVKRPPPMKPGTRKYLERLFERENLGLSALLGIDVGSLWNMKI